MLSRYAVELMPDWDTVELTLGWSTIELALGCNDKSIINQSSMLSIT